MLNSRVRMNIRNFLVGLTVPEIQTELSVSIEQGRFARAECIEEYLNEVLAEGEDYAS